MMADNALYMGAPIPHKFGEDFTVGPWLVTVEGDNITCDPLLLPHYYPRFRHHSIATNNIDRLRLPDYRDDDYNRISCLPSVYERVRIMYPGAEIERLKTNKPDFSGARFSREELGEPSKMLLRYTKLKGVRKEDQETILKLGLDVVKEVNKQ